MRPEGRCWGCSNHPPQALTGNVSTLTCWRWEVAQKTRWTEPVNYSLNAGSAAVFHFYLKNTMISGNQEAGFLCSLAKNRSVLGLGGVFLFFWQNTIVNGLCFWWVMPGWIFRFNCLLSLIIFFCIIFKAKFSPLMIVIMQISMETNLQDTVISIASTTLCDLNVRKVSINFCIISHCPIVWKTPKANI